MPTFSAFQRLGFELSCTIQALVAVDVMVVAGTGEARVAAVANSHFVVEPESP